jgi:Flp pilus assembly protein TadG
MNGKRGASRGQGLVEFALVLPIFLVLVFGIIDGGRAIFAYNQMAQAARSVARVASTTCFATTPACNEGSGAIADAITTQSAGNLASVSWTVDCINPSTKAPPTNTGADFCKVGYLVRVTASSPFGFVTPVASSFGPIVVGSSTEQEILQ